MSEHRSAIVTGAGSGIGRATALLLAEAGYRVTLVGRTREKLQQTAAQFSDEDAAVVWPADLTHPQASATIVRQTLTHFGRIDAIAHIAGDAPLLPIEQLTPEIVQRCLGTNLAAAAYLAAAAWPVFKQQHDGVIVNVSSMASLDPYPGFALYAAAKLGVNMFTRCLAQEGEAIGLRAVTIAPGAVETPMLRALFDETRIPPRCTLSPAEVARVIVQCITGQRTFAPGELIVMNSP